MNTNTMRVIVGAAAVVVAVGLFVVLKDDGGNDSDSKSSVDGSSKTSIDGSGKGNSDARPKANTEPQPLTIVIENGKPVGGVQSLTLDEGERVRFKVDSDVSEEIHVHGYDLMKEVEAGGSVSFDFPATIEGGFEVELEDRGEPILELTVNP